MMMETSLFSGKTPDVALIIAGIHGTEVSGIEVANWVRVKLARRTEAGRRPTFTTLVVSEVFPESTNKSREVVWPAGKGKTPFQIPPNRQYPPPGKPLQFLEDRGGPVAPDGTRITKDASSPARFVKGGVPLLEGTRELLRLIEMSQPRRIASIHAHKLVGSPKKGVDAPGIFVDPRYEYREGTSSGGCQVDLIDPTAKDQWGTLPCKFDVRKDPAFPRMGRIVVLNEMLQQGKVPKDIKAKADKGRSLYRAGKHEEALEELTKAADDVGITLKPDFDLAARSENGRRGDDPLAREIARKMRRDLVPGNHFGDPPEVVHYAESAGHPDGFSLGDWAPAAVQGPVGKRDGAPVITVEVWAYPDSGAFRDGVQLVDEQCKALKGLAATDAKLARRVNPKRCKDLQAYADALIELFLEP